MIAKLLRHSGWNLAGQAVPMVVGLISIPILIKGIGDSRFGFLSIAWMLVGYFGVLDLGIGRALTHGVAKRLAHDSGAELGDLAWTGIGTLVAIGVIAAAGLAASSYWLAHSFMSIADELRPEAFRALLVVALAVPFVLLSAGLSGILQARQEFRVINLIQMPMGVLLYAGPLLVLRFSVALPWVILPLVIVRAANAAALFVVCSRRVAGFLRPAFRRDTLRELLGFGGWMTVSNVVSPIMVNMDRLFIGSRLSVSAVTYYVTPFEVIAKLLMIPSSVANASFPEFSRLAKLDARDEVRRYLMRSVALVFLVLLPPVIILAAIAHPALAWWVSPELADRSAGIMRILAVGILINGLSYVPFAYVQGMGRSDVTAIFHLIEFVLYVPALVLLISWMGLTGVAVAWVLRVSLDAILLFGYAATRLGTPPAAELRVGDESLVPGVGAR